MLGDKFLDIEAIEVACWVLPRPGQGAPAPGLHCGEAHGTVVLQAGHTDARHGIGVGWVGRSWGFVGGLSLSWVL